MYIMVEVLRQERLRDRDLKAGLASSFTPEINYYIPMEYPEVESSHELPLVVPPGDQFQWNPVDFPGRIPVQGNSFNYSIALAAAELGINAIEVQNDSVH